MGYLGIVLVAWAFVAIVTAATVRKTEGWNKWMVIFLLTWPISFPVLIVVLTWFEPRWFATMLD